MSTTKNTSTKSLSEKQEILARKLIQVWRDREFVLGIICTLINDDEVQEMIDYVDSEEEKTPSDLTTMALLIANNRNKEDIIKDDFYGDIMKLAKESGLQ